MDVWADFLEEPRLKDPKYKDPRNRRQSVKEMKELVEAKLATQKSHDFLKKAMAARLVVGVVQSPEEVVDCVHLAERGSWMVIDHPEVGTLKYPGTGFITQMGNPVEGSRPAPLLGQHNREIYCDKLGLTNDQLSQLTGAGII
jgi:crotonobetainyl-CoA:carnitine CoA-transferase CaiB-like acyl-CoA transferase